MRNLYKITRPDWGGYDTYDSAVVVADSEEGAKFIHPDGKSKVGDEGYSGTWVAFEQVIVQYLGKTKLDKGVICASFNAG